VGWNEAEPVRTHPVFPAGEPAPDFYFVHSYHLRPRRAEDVLARTPYCGGFVSAVARDNMVGVQFHPEKSQKAGFAFLRRFLAW
jgi:glutamine amidotransferase